MRNSNKLVRGIGIKGDKYSSWDGKEILKEYSLWNDMLFRCTEKCWAKRQTYLGVTCSDSFKSYTFFYEWCQEQIGFTNKDEKGRHWQLDKDVLFKNSKIYSEDTCVFVPARINSLLIKVAARRGEWPIGVYWSKKGSGSFNSYCSDSHSKVRHLGCFNTPQEAFLAYKTFKEALIKQVANEYKEQLDPRVYEALMNYEVNEND